MKILVIGAGATGGFLGARLARAGRDVTFLVRPRRAEVLRERGLRLTGQGEPEVLAPRLVTPGAATGRYDLVLVSVKAAALATALDDAAPAIGPGTTVVPFLNGMAHMDVLNSRFGADAVLGGVVMVATMVDDEGDIVRLDPLAAMKVGAQDGGASARLEEVRRRWRAADSTWTSRRTSSPRCGTSGCSSARSGR